jgi:hypothetical protein
MSKAIESLRTFLKISSDDLWMSMGNKTMKLLENPSKTLGAMTRQRVLTLTSKAHPLNGNE